MNFLSHIIRNGIIKPSVEKTVTAQIFSEPRNAREVKNFLRLPSYFKKRIPFYVIIARLLRGLLRTSRFKFEQEQKLPFQKFKDILNSKKIYKICIS